MKIEIGGASCTYEDKRGVYSVFMERPDGQRPLGIPRQRWGNDIKLDL
jgi:hypothetical protein